MADVGQTHPERGMRVANWCHGPGGNTPGLALQLHLPALLPNLGGRVRYGQLPPGVREAARRPRDTQGDLRD
jgi:hypothetical protein